MDTPIANAPAVAPALSHLHLGSIEPQGWLQRQLRIQADGLGGHLHEFWPDIARSKWIGGDADGWERGPYWLDGMIPLAVLLGDERLLAVCRHWVDEILARQTADGWMGPENEDSKEPSCPPHDPWPVAVAFKALAQWHEATGDTRIAPAMARACGRVAQRLAERPLEAWARMRWQDLAWGVQWLQSVTGDPGLTELLATLHAQGYDWAGHFREFVHTGRSTEWTYETHVVNQAQALKAPAVTPGRGTPAEVAKEAKGWTETLWRHHGQANGMFTGDECLAGLNPSQGTELCAVVETIFSMAVLAEATGDVAFGDRLEEIAFNALPATFDPDMVAHQYDQQANQVQCRVSEERVFTTNDAYANIFGLEPNYGCCTANFHQGWPKFASHLWMATTDGGLAAVAWAPCRVKAPPTDERGAVEIDVETDYPFDDRVTVRVRGESPGGLPMPLHLRIPSWCTAPEVSGDCEMTGNPAPGNYFTVRVDPRKCPEIRLRFPMEVRTRSGWAGSVSFHRGPLTLAYPIAEEWRLLIDRGRFSDWEVLARGPWNYAVNAGGDGQVDAEVTTAPVGDKPFSPAGAPVRVTIRARELPGWTMEKNAAAPPPPSPVPIPQTPETRIELIPYGSTNLRVTEFPRVAP